MKKAAFLNRVKQYVDGINSILVKNKLKVSKQYKMVDGIRCVEVILDGNFIYKDRIELLCDHTDSTLRALRLQDSQICMFFEERIVDESN